MSVLALPNAAARITTPLGAVTPEWRDWFTRLSEGVTDESVLAAIAALQQQVAALQASGIFTFKIIGLESVVALGLPANGNVQVALVNDLMRPGNTYFYGTGPDGVKGWSRVADAVEAAEGELTKTVDADTNVPTFGLADVTVTAGGALRKTAFDAKGRLAADGDPTTDDLPEGATNLYFTDARAIAALEASGLLIRSATFEWGLDPTDPTYITLAGPTPAFPELSIAGANIFASGSGLYQLAPSGADPTLSGYFDLPPGELLSDVSDARVYSLDGRFWSPAASFTADPGTPGRVLYTGAIGFVAKTLPKPWPTFTQIPVESEIGVAGNGFIVSLYGVNPFKISVFKADSSTYTTDFTATGLSDPVTFRVYKL